MSSIYGLTVNIRRNLELVKENIARSAIRVRRSPEDIHLMVVTKTHSIDTIKCLIEEGVKHLGENYVEEATEKIRALTPECPCFWHMIGHIQSRKSSQVVEFFDYIHSVDSLKLASRLNTYAGTLNKILPVFLEFNLSGEETKSGWLAGIDQDWRSLLPELESIVQLSNLNICGLMTMPPYFENPEDARPFFKRLNNLRDFLMRHLKNIDLKELSMGMSVDYEVAIEEGATWVRIGQAILGPRHS
jgi:hypothetical protein